MSLEFHLFLPQMRLPMPVLVERAQAAEAAGFTGIALMDHLAPPMAEDKDMTDAMVTATWLAAHTSTLTISHLVLCDTFRHPAMLARQATTLDHASNGRFELGIGWGSVPSEFETFGVGDTNARARVGRLGESLEVIEALWTGQKVNYDGDFHQLTDAIQRPTPLDQIPIVIGGAGPRTLDLVAKHATWWNCPVHQLHRYDEMRQKVGGAKASVQQMLGFIPDESQRAEVSETAKRRFGYHTGDALLVGNSDEVTEAYRGFQERGMERVYVWFTDFASPETLAAFGEQVIPNF